MLLVRRFTFSFPHFSRPTTHEKYDVLEWYVTDSFLINTRMNRRTYCSGESNGQMQCKRSRAFLISTTWNTYSGLIGNTKATRTHHGWVHMFIIHRPALTLQLHKFDLFRTWRTSSFCTVARQLVRFQLTRRIARSLGDSWACCCNNCTLSWYFWLADN